MGGGHIQISASCVRNFLFELDVSNGAFFVHRSESGTGKYLKLLLNELRSKCKFCLKKKFNLRNQSESISEISEKIKIVSKKITIVSNKVW